MIFQWCNGACSSSIHCEVQICRILVILILAENFGVGLHLQFRDLLIIRIVFYIPRLSFQHVFLTFVWDWFKFEAWFGWLVVFNVPSTARSFRDGTPIYCPLRMTWSSINSLHRSDRESNPGPSHGSPLRYRWATRSSWTLILESITKTSRSYKMKGIKGSNNLP